MIDRIRTIIDKEWAEVFKNRLVLFTVTGLPLLLTIIPLIVLRSTAGIGSAELDRRASRPGPRLRNFVRQGLSGCLHDQSIPFAFHDHARDDTNYDRGLQHRRGKNNSQP